MIRALILYFLDIKPTHGYEIQKYIQLNQMNDWTKIQSGSIYYALAKLEKTGFIQIIREENVGQKVRKIYSITESGKEELEKLLAKEFAKPIQGVKSDKFIAYPFISGMDKEKLKAVVKKHIESIEQELAKLKKWQQLKMNENTLAIEKISFEMMMSNLGYQIKWHEAFLDEIDKTIEISKNIKKFIANTDFSEVSSLNIEEVNRTIYQK